MDAEPPIIAGTAIERDGAAVLLTGPSGRGKSDLALRAISTPLLLPGEAEARPFRLVSDDRTAITVTNGILLATAPPPLRGLLEVRGIGIIPVPSICDVPLVLVAELSDGPIERMPLYPGQLRIVHGIELAVFSLEATHASAPVKLALALKRACGKLATVE